MIGLNLPLETVYAYLLIVVRVGAMLLALPFFNSRAVPVWFKAGLLMAVSLILLPRVPAPGAARLDLATLALAGAAEILVGFGIGLMTQMVFAAVQIAGEMIGIQMGMAVANVFDPLQQTQVALMAQLKNLFAMLILLATDGHHLIILALVESFARVPLLAAGLTAPLIELLLDLAGEMFVTAVKVAAPLMAAMLLTSVALGLVARTVPQMNVFLVAMPLKILLGLFFTGVCLSTLALLLTSRFELLAEHMRLYWQLVGR